MLNRLGLWLRALLRKAEMERELDEELRFHLEKEVEQNLARGMGPEAARLAALRRFGGVERVKEESRDVRGVRFLEELWQDLHYGALPCSDSSAECLRRLANLAAENCPELRVISQALAYQRRKLWTSWLNADGLNPLAVSLRLARNLAGGGDRAAARLEIAELERRRAEVEAALRQAVAREAAEAEAAGRRLRGARERLEAHRARIRLLEVGYRLGEGSTEAMLGEWLAGEGWRDRAAEAEAERGRALTRLWSLVTLTARPTAGVMR